MRVNSKKQLASRRVVRSSRKVGSVTFVLVIIGSVGAVWIFALGLLAMLDRMSANGETTIHESAVADLWPSDSQTQALLDMLQSCIPESANDATCRQRRPQGSSMQQIAVARPPGSFGKIWQSFVEDMEHNVIDKNQLELAAVSHIISDDHSYTKVIRFAVLPILLEAVDLILGTTDETFTQGQLTVSDVQDVVRLLIHWHCRQSKLATNTALLTMTAKKLMSRPQEAAQQIISFLDATTDTETELMSAEFLDDWSNKVLRRIDECSVFVSDLQKQYPGHHLDEMTDGIIKNEFDGGDCGDTDTDERFRKTRVTKIVQHMLGPKSGSICEAYPTIVMCTAV